MADDGRQRPPRLMALQKKPPSRPMQFHPNAATMPVSTAASDLDDNHYLVQRPPFALQEFLTNGTVCNVVKSPGKAWSSVGALAAHTTTTESACTRLLRHNRVCVRCSVISLSLATDCCCARLYVTAFATIAALSCVLAGLRHRWNRWP